MIGRTSHALRNLFFVGCAAGALAACAHSVNEGATLEDGLLAGQADIVAASGMDPIAEAAFWGTRFDSDPTNPDIAVKYGRALRRIGSLAEAVSVLERTQPRFPEHLEIRAELGKALTAQARAFEGVRHLEYAATHKRDDWTILSAYGVALDQIGDHEGAQKQYDAALALTPDNITLLNNKGLSLALAGDLSEAERMLRAAAAHPDAPATTRQNLALILGLKGDFTDAERLARADLPPPVAENNIAYYRSLLSQPAYWRQLQSMDGGDTPASVADAAAPTEEPMTAAMRAAVASAPLKPVQN